MRLKLDRERQLEALADFISAYEAGHGEITPEEIRMAGRRARADAIVVRGGATAKSVTTVRRRQKTR